MIEATGEVTEDGIRLPRQVLEEATAEEIKKRALQYLFREAGDMAAIRIPRREGDRWRVGVALMPDGIHLGELAYTLDGTLIASASTSPAEMLAAAELSE